MRPSLLAARAVHRSLVAGLTQAWTLVLPSGVGCAATSLDKSLSGSGHLTQQVAMRGLGGKGAVDAGAERTSAHNRPTGVR